MNLMLTVNNDASPRPRRAVRVVLTIEADSWNEATAEVLRVARHVGDCGAKCQLVSGGYSTSAIVEVLEREITHDQYIEELEAYIARGDKATQAGSAGGSPVGPPADPAVVVGEDAEPPAVPPAPEGLAGHCDRVPSVGGQGGGA